MLQGRDVATAILLLVISLSSMRYSNEFCAFQRNKREKRWQPKQSKVVRKRHKACRTGGDGSVSRTK